MAIGAGEYFPVSPIAIRDGTVTRLQTVPGLKGVFKGRTIPMKDGAMPYACVWHAGDRTDPIGDANVGEPRFMHTLALAIDVVTSAPNEATLDTDIVTLVEAIKATLLTDTSWVELFEGIESFDTRYIYPPETNLFFVQAAVEVKVTFRSSWPPYAPNDFEQVQVTAKIPNAASQTGPLLQVFNVETDP